MPDTAGSPRAGEPSDAPRSAAEQEATLNRRQLELPDGRYLLTYSSSTAAGDDA